MQRQIWKKLLFTFCSVEMLFVVVGLFALQSGNVGCLCSVAVGCASG